MNIEDIPFKIREIYNIVSELEESFPHRSFTLDGHLLGSIGEVYAEHFYELNLAKPSTKDFDATFKSNKGVQIKITQRNRIGMRGLTDLLLVLKVNDKGEISEVYNGEMKDVWDLAGKIQKNGQRNISLKKMIEINKNGKMKIPLRK